MYNCHTTFEKSVTVPVPVDGQIIFRLKQMEIITYVLNLFKIIKMNVWDGKRKYFNKPTELHLTHDHISIHSSLYSNEKQG